jgi:hypothetical protein
MKPQSETIRYFVQYQDGKVLGFALGEYAPATRWYEGQSFETSEEANRWAAERSKNKLWRLIQVDLEVDADPSLTRFVTPEEADFWHAQQEQLWSDDVAFNPGVRDFLAKLGADEAVIEFIEAAAPENQGKLANVVRKQPTITVDELEKWSEEKLKTKRTPDRFENDFATRFAQNCTEVYAVPATPAYMAAYNWMIVQLMKLRTGKTQIYKELSHDHLWNDPDDFDARPRKFSAPREDLIFTNVFYHEVPDWVRNTEPELYSYDLYTARAASDEWHAQCKLAGSGENYEKTHPANIIAKLSNGWTIQYISSEHDLEVEGNRMGHCVASYWDSVQAHKSQIYSLRDLKNEPHATIEFGVYPSMKTRMVRQIQGKSNEEPIAEYKELIREWLLTIPDVQWEHGGGWELDRYGDLDDAAKKIDELATPDDRDAYGVIAKRPDFDDVYSAAYRLAEASMSGRRNGNWRGHDITSSLAAYAVVYDKKYPGEVEKVLYKAEEEGMEKAYSWDCNCPGFEDDYEREHPKPDPDDYENGEEDDELIAAEKKWEEEMDEARMESESDERDEQMKSFFPYAFPNDVLNEYYMILERKKKK